jgi:hypothetical protein
MARILPLPPPRRALSKVTGAIFFIGGGALLL